MCELLKHNMLLCTCHWSKHLMNLLPSYTADLVKLRQLNTQMLNSYHVLCISYMSLAKINCNTNFSPWAEIFVSESVKCPHLQMWFILISSDGIPIPPVTIIYCTWTNSIKSAEGIRARGVHREATSLCLCHLVDCVTWWENPVSPYKVIIIWPPYMSFHWQELILIRPLSFL